MHSAVDSPALTVAGASVQHRECRTRPGHMQVVYTLQPESLTRRLMFVCSSLFHLNPIKMLFHTNWIFLSCHINLLHRLLVKTAWLAPGLSCHQMQNRRKPSDTVLIKVFFDFPFWVTSHFYGASVIVGGGRRWGELRPFLNFTSEGVLLWQSQRPCRIFSFWPQAVII